MGHFSSTSLWDVRQRDENEKDRVTLGLPTEEVRELISTGALSVEDELRPSATEDKPKVDWKQIGILDEFASVAMGSRSRRRHEMVADDEADLTPMIDVVFLLLIFFMVTASFHFQKGLDFPPGSEASESVENNQLPGVDQFQDSLIVGIDNRNNYSFRTVDQPRIPGELLNSEELVITLKDRSRDQSTSKMLIISDEYASHEALVALIDSAAQAGIEEVVLADPKNQTHGTNTPTIIRQNP